MGSNAKLAFPEGFLWGSATSSYQVEGGNENNDWWAWEHIPGRIRDGSRCGPASDWWHRAETDLDTAAQLGQNTHRLSLEWSRIEPEEGAWDDAAIVRYRQILSAMRELDILPLVTLHHFTLPLWLYERGGWEYERAATHFVRYVNRVVSALSDLCQIWCTINEPMVHLAYGYIYGLWPPGYGGWRGARRAFRHMAEAHAKAYEVIHHRQPNASVGYAKQIHLFDPAHPGRWRDRIVARAVDHLFNESALAAYADGTLLFPFGRERRDGGVVKWLDFIGLNYYSRSLVELDLRRKDEWYLHRFPKPDSPFSMEGWGELYADGLYRALKRVARHGLPVYVTEFGVPDNDDSLRPRFIVEHVAAMHRALGEEVRLRGAYFWSLVDNFEWHEGWRARFGLIGLDPVTQERTLTRSAPIYQRIATANGLERALVEEVAPDLVEDLFE